MNVGYIQEYRWHSIVHDRYVAKGTPPWDETQTILQLAHHVMDEWTIIPDIHILYEASNRDIILVLRQFSIVLRFCI